MREDRESGRRRGDDQQERRAKEREEEEEDRVSDSFVFVSQKLQSRDQEDNQELQRSAHIMHTQLKIALR